MVYLSGRAEADLGPSVAVAERTFLFLSERRQQYGKGELKHDAEWIQTHLQVFEVR